ncbi:uncharacterized protein LOC131946789 isoform X2 [Physella acuta]|uniref:uncharacterized protein LOC131946789 isoform X2 n=1 Tax=Physella acuta TaxID=109671 RepID=UPI0027DE5A83|nr:uncharacterized protein LOC131946789 isoform X2 [Physella acuta]
MELLIPTLTLLAHLPVAAAYKTDIPRENTRAIVRPSTVAEEENYNVYCDPDIAGVPKITRVQGVSNLSVDWTDGHRPPETYASYSVWKPHVFIRPTRPVPADWLRRWVFDVRAGEALNGRGLMDRSAVSIKMSATRARLTESGTFCCNASYHNFNGEVQSVARCEAMKVTHHDIVSRKRVKVNGPFTLTCDANHVGVPRLTSGLYRLVISFSEGGERRVLARLGIGSFQLKVASPPETWPPRNWTFTFHGAEKLDDSGRLNRDAAVVELSINDALLADSGCYCCQATYFLHSTDVEHDLTRCANVTVTESSIIEPKVVSVGRPFNVTCDPDLAGVEEVIYGVQLMMITWAPPAEQPVDMAHMISDTKPRIFFNHTLSHWQFKFRGDQTINAADTFDRNMPQVSLTVQTAMTSDSGRFCCHARYYATVFKKVEHCQDLYVQEETSFSPMSLLFSFSFRY